MKAHIMTGTGTINAGPFTGVPGDAGTGGAIGDPTMLETRWPDTDIPISQPLPAGATVETTLVKTDRWNPDQFTNYLKVANQVVNVLERTGTMKGIPTGIDIGEALSYIATGAAIGTSIGPGIGTAIGAAVGLVLYAVNFIIRSGSGPVGPYPNQQVAWWAGQFAEQAFIDWAVNNQVNTWGSTSDICRSQMVWWVETFGVAITAGTGGKFYSGKPDDIYIGYCGGEDAAADLYKQLGIDYYATKAARKANPETNQYDIHMQFGATTKMAGAGASNLMPLLIGGAAVLYLSNKR